MSMSITTRKQVYQLAESDVKVLLVYRVTTGAIAHATTHYILIMSQIPKGTKYEYLFKLRGYSATSKYFLFLED
jgi:hypothetical protein